MELSKIIENHKGLIFSVLKLTGFLGKVLHQIQHCRTSAMGGHWYVCDNCGTSHLLYNSCRNRNCPQCQANKRRKWVERQCAGLLNIPYYHVVFTVPHVLNPLFIENQVLCYNILFHTVWETLKGFFKNPDYLGGSGGMFCILHTWGQNLSLHPHLHCIVPGAGITDSGEFKILRGKDRYLFNIKALRTVFRAKFTAELTKAEKDGKLKINYLTRKQMYAKQWVVYCKRPFANPRAVVEYIGRYSHRVAISNSRIISDIDNKISFQYKDYKNNSTQRIMQLDVIEFFRRFIQHILPQGFVKIRHYGLMSNSNKKKFIESGEKVVGKAQLIKLENQTNEGCEDIQPTNAITCPACKKGKLQWKMSFTAFDLSSGIAIINAFTAQVVYQSRAGPIDDTFKLIFVNN